MKYARHLLWGGVTLLAGCAALPSALTSASHATLRIVPRVIEGRQVQAVYTGYTKDDIDHFTVELAKLVGGVPQQPLVVAHAGRPSGKGLTVGKLMAGARYRLTAYAYLASGALISDPASSSAEIVVPATDDDAGTTTLPVALVDKLFGGVATASISLTEGQLLSPGAIKTSFGMLVSAFVGGGVANADGEGSVAGFVGPTGIARAPNNGDFFVADNTAARIRRITAAGVVGTFAGNGTTTVTDGVGTAAGFNYPVGITVDATGTIYVAEYNSCLLRKITPNATVTTIAGAPGGGEQDGTGASAKFGRIMGLVSDSHGNIFATDNTYHKIRKFTPAGVMTTFAGNGTTTVLNNPTGLAIGPDDTLYVADTYNHRIRKITSNGVISTLAGSGTAGTVDGVGTGAQIQQPNSLALIGGGNLLVAQLNGVLRIVSPNGSVYTVAGKPGNGNIDGRGDEARIGMSFGMVAFSDSTALMTEYSNNRIRTVSF